MLRYVEAGSVWAVMARWGGMGYVPSSYGKAVEVSRVKFRCVKTCSGSLGELMAER